MANMKSYSEVQRRLKRAAGSRLQKLCTVRRYDLWWLELGTTRRARKSVVLTGGIHGDEPAGVEAVLRFLENPLPRWARGIRFVVFPCMNPHGYEHNTRNNHADLDINRQYRNSDLAEVTAQKRVLDGQWFDLHVALHEDVDASGFYIYELSRTNRQIARRIVSNVSRVIPFDPRPVIEGRRAHKGVIRRAHPPRRKHWPEAIYMFARHADHTLTTETPGPYDFEKRVAAQGIALQTACELLRCR